MSKYEEFFDAIKKSAIENVGKAEKVLDFLAKKAIDNFNGKIERDKDDNFNYGQRISVSYDDISKELGFDITPAIVKLLIETRNCYGLNLYTDQHGLCVQISYISNIVNNRELNSEKLKISNEPF